MLMHPLRKIWYIYLLFLWKIQGDKNPISIVADLLIDMIAVVNQKHNYKNVDGKIEILFASKERLHQKYVEKILVLFLLELAMQ